YIKDDEILPASRYRVLEIPFGIHSSDVRLSAVSSPKDFYLQLISSLDSLEKLMDDMQVFYKSKSGLSYSDWAIYTPEIGMICVAEYPQDGKWYRALIKDLPCERMVDVKLVDFGIEERVFYNALMKISDEFIKLPEQ
ncbi:hypothetical protein SK128_019028, partial [Halocaridina rubra]